MGTDKVAHCCPAIVSAAITSKLPAVVDADQGGTSGVANCTEQPETSNQNARSPRYTLWRPSPRRVYVSTAGRCGRPLTGSVSVSVSASRLSRAETRGWWPVTPASSASRRVITPSRQPGGHRTHVTRCAPCALSGSRAGPKSPESFRQEDRALS